MCRFEPLYHFQPADHRIAPYPINANHCAPLFCIASLDREGRHSSRSEIDKTTVIGNSAITKQSCEHRQCLVSERLVDEGFLPV